MEEVYIEFLSELEISLRELEHSWYHKWIQRSIDKFRETGNTSYFLSAFGGSGSLNDEFYQSEVTRALLSITYYCAKNIEKGIPIEEALSELSEQKKLSLEYWDRKPDGWQKQTEVSCLEKEIDYLDSIAEGYVPGNLHELTTNYLSSQPKHKNK